MLKKILPKNLKIVIKDETLEEAIAWQELCEKLVHIYEGKISYTEVIGSLIVSKAIFYQNVKENKENETIS